MAITSRTALSLSVDVTRAHARWAECGGMELTGDEAGPPLAPPAPVAAVMEAGGTVLGVDDAAALVGERGLSRHGSTSCGGATRLLRCADGWVAVALPRPEDLASVPAWLGVAPAADEPWDEIALRLQEIPAGDAVARARLLEIPVSTIGETDPVDSPWLVTPGPEAEPLDRTPLVLDLSALWAGPLCTDLLQRRGARVIKVEDARRPDGARSTPGFFDLLNGAKSLETIDISRDLAARLHEADVVVSSARPRAFEQLGVDVHRLLADRPVVWVAITGHGWHGPGRDRVGFGDDAAVAGGLVADAGDRPVFVADAVADPLCGTLAAAAASACLARGGSWFIDAPLARAAAYAASFASGKTVAAVRATDGSWALADGDHLVPVRIPRSRTSR